MKARLCVVLVFGLLAAVLASTASANSIVITNFPDYTAPTTTVSGICPSPIDVTASVWNMTRTQFFDNDGIKTAAHWRWVEQDTFTGPTGSLVGEPFAVEQFLSFASDGTRVSAYVNGVLERVRLPDGRFFITAGRVDFLGITDWIWLPDSGHFGDIDAFCAALGA
jgi:hypothetical protein